MQLKGKKVVILGERDGVQGPDVGARLKSSGAKPLLVQPQCLVELVPVHLTWKVKKLSKGLSNNTAKMTRQ